MGRHSDKSQQNLDKNKQAARDRAAERKATAKKAAIRKHYSDMLHPDRFK